MIGVPVEGAGEALAADASAPRCRWRRSFIRYATHLFFKKEKAGRSGLICMSTIFGDARVEPRVFDGDKPVAVKVVDHEEHTVDKPHGDAEWQHNFNSFNNLYDASVLEAMWIRRGFTGWSAGDEAAMSVLFLSMNEFEQVAAGRAGVLGQDQAHFFAVPKDAAECDVFRTGRWR